MSISKRIIHDLPADDLVKLLEGASAEEVFEKITEAGKFVYALNIRHGDTKISAQLVYFTYRRYKGWDNKRQSKGHFFKDFKKHFEPHRDNNGMYYLLDPKPFDLSQETYFLMRSEIRNEKGQRSKKEKKSE